MRSTCCVHRTCTRFSFPSMDVTRATKETACGVPTSFAMLSSLPSFISAAPVRPPLDCGSVERFASALFVTAFMKP